MRILVTGGAGYVGSILVEQLLARGDEVAVLDSFLWGQVSLAHLCSTPTLTIVRGDARDMRVMKPLLASADVLIPLAALVGAPLCEMQVQTAWDVNCYAVDLAIRCMSQEQRIIIPISNSGYGVGEQGRECDEDTPLRPISVYGQTKVEVEKRVMSRGNVISLRLATLFGMSPRMRLDLLVNDFVWRAVHDRAIVLFEPHFRRCYVHVRDAALAFVHALNNYEAMKDRAYNVGLSDANISKLELCERIKMHTPLSIHISKHGEDPDRRDYVVSNARVEATGWRPLHSLDDGIAELIRGYQMLRVTEHGNV